MPLRTLLFVIIVALIATFTALNWSAFAANTVISLGFASVQAPLGLIMLGIVVVMTVLFLFFIAYFQTSVLLEARRHAKELHEHRALADQAEASRFTELRQFLSEELAAMNQHTIQSQAVILGKISELEQQVLHTAKTTENSIVAYVAELDERVSRSNHTVQP
ncbi:MAG: LapA family protein [Moraxellaceae bacterium]|nr:LapA family protein [Moraxellaceae bacterium]MCP5176745.1 LapA family protein [Moraxellaceae bacterium]